MMTLLGDFALTLRGEAELTIGKVRGLTRRETKAV